MGPWAIFAIVLSAVSFTASYVQAKKAQKKAKRLADEMAGVLLNKESNIQAIPVVYGERRVGGVRVFMSTSGDTRHKYLYVALVVSEGAVEQISDLEIDEVPATDSRFQGLVSYHYKLGTDDQTTSTVLDDALITEEQIFDDAERDYQGVIVTNQDFVDDFRLRGVAYVAIRLEYDAEVFGGVPDFTVKVKGRKVYDPRQDSTSSLYDSTVGVATQRATDSSTWEWSDNPAICLRDYLTNDRFGKGLSSSDLDEAQFASAADDLDSFTVTPYSGSSSNIKLFTLNAVLDTNDEIFTNVEKILLSCRGYLPYSFGKYGLKIDQAGTSVMTLDTSNIIGDIAIVGSRKEDRFNQVIVKFPDANTRFQPNNAIWPNPSSDNDTLVSDGQGGYLTESELHDEFLADDDELLIDEVDLDYCTNFYQARDLARIFLWRSRNAINIAFQATSEAMELTVGDVVSITHPTPNWTAKKFQVDEMGINYDGTVTLKCIEYDSTIYSYDSSAEEIEAIDIIRGDTSALLGPTNVSGNNTGSTVLDDGTFHAVLNVSWTAADDATVIEYEVRYKLSTASTYEYLNTTGTSLTIQGMTPGIYNIGVRSINYVGEKSAFVDGSNVDTGVDTSIPGNITNLSFTSGVRAITVEWSNPTDADYAFTEIHVKTSNVTPQATDLPTAKVAGEEYVYPTAAGVVSRYFFLRAVDRTGNKGSFTGTTNNQGSSLQATGDDIGPGEVDTGEIADDAVTFEKIDVSELSAISADVGSITAGTLQAGGSNAIPDANDSPSGSETGAFIDLDNGKFVFGDANKHLLYDGSTLLVKGELEADILDVIDATITGQLTANAISAGAVTVASLSAGVFAEFDDRYGTSGGFYVTDTDEFFDGSGTKYVTVGTVAHSTNDIYFECRLNHSWSYPRNDTGDKLKANVSFEYSTDNSTWTTVPSSTTQVATATGVVAQYATLYSIAEDITYTMTGSSLAAGNYYFRVKIVAQNSTNAFQLAALGSANGVPIAFEVQESSGISAAGGNADTLDGLDSTQFLRSDTDDTFDADLTITGALHLQGALNITGDINSHNVTDLDVTDRTITVNAGGSVTTSNGAGLIIDRGSATDASLTFDETNDEFDLNFPVRITTDNNARALTLERGSPSADQVAIRFLANGTRYFGKGSDDNPYWSSALDITSQGDRIWTAGDFANNSTNWNTAYTYSQVGHVPLAGGTMTGDLTIQKTTPRILLKDNNGSSGSYPEIEFETSNNQGVKLYHTEFDGELPTAGYGLVLAESDTNNQFPTTGTLAFLVLGEMYAGDTTLADTHKVWHRGDLTDTNKTNYDTAYTYSQVGHLPLTGGSVTGNVSVAGLTTTGNIVNDIGNSGDDSFIELKNTGYTGNVTSLRQNADSTRAELNSSQRSIWVQAGLSSSNSAEFRVYTNAVEALKLDASQNATFGGTIDSGAITTTGLLHLDFSTSTPSSATGTTFLKIDNYVGSDLNQQKSFIDFIFQDDNTNETPQVRIGAEVGQNGDANTQEKEGSGAFVVYTNNAENVLGDAGASLAERFRVDYVGNVDIVTGALKIGGTSIIGSNTRITAGDGTTTKAAYGFQSSGTTGISYSSTQNRVNFLSAGAVVAYVQTPSTNPIADAFYVDGTSSFNGKISVTGHGNSSQWNTAYGWGDHSTAGYPHIQSSAYNGVYNIPIHATGDLYTTPSAGNVTITGSTGQISTPNHGNSSQWNTAYGWGDHSTAGYLTAEADTLTSVTGRGSSTTNAISTGAITAPSISLEETATTDAEIVFVDQDAAENFAIKLNGEQLDFYEPEDTDKLHMRIVDDSGVNAVFGFRTGVDDGTLRLTADGDLNNIGHLQASDYIQLGLGTTNRQNTDYLYVGGSGLNGSDAAIYLGNAGDGSGYGWRFYYKGSGNANDNELIIRSENLHNSNSEVDALTFKQDGTATFANRVGINVAANNSYYLYVGGSIAQSSGSIYAFGDIVIGQGGLKRGSTTLIDSSRNMSNIATITTEGLITVSQSQQGLKHIAPDVMSGHTSRNEMLTSFTADETRWYMVPNIDGSYNFGREFSFNYSTQEWSIEGPFTASGNLTVSGTLSSSGVITSTGSNSGRYTGLEIVNTTNAAGTETAIGLGVVSAGNNNCDVKLVANRVGANFGSDFYIEQTDSSGNQQETFRVSESGAVSFTGTLSSGEITTSVGMIVTDTSSTGRGIYRNSTGYDLRVGGGTDNTDGAFISLSGETRGGADSAYNGRIEYVSGGEGFANQAAVLGDHVWYAKHAGGSANLMVLDSATGDLNLKLGDFQVNGSTVFDVNRNAFVAEYLYHMGDTDTNLRFQDNRATLTSGGGASVDAHSNGNLYLNGTQVVVYGNYTSTGTISSANLTISSDTRTEIVAGSSAGTGVGLLFSDHFTSTNQQQGYLDYFHQDSKSYGSGNAFIFSSNQTGAGGVSVLIDGKLLFKDSLHMKPASGTSTSGTTIIDSSRNLQNVASITSQGVIKSKNAGVSNAVTATHAYIVSEQTESGVQVIADDGGDFAAWMALSNANSSSGANKHYWLHNAPSTASSNAGDLEIRYSTTTAAGQIGGQGTGSTAIAQFGNSGNFTIAGRMTASDGTLVKAAYGFANSSTTGISYSATNNRVNILSGGAVKAYVQTGSSNPVVHTMVVDGSVEWSGGSSSEANTAYGQKINSLAFSTSTGVLTATRNDNTTLTVDLDNRYIEITSTTQDITANSYLSGEGSAASPAFQVGDTNSGFYDSGGDTIGVALGGAQEFNFTTTELNLLGNNLETTGHVKAGTGSVSAPSFQVGDNDSGFYDSGANEIGITLGGVAEYEFTTTQFNMAGNNLVTTGTISSGGITSTGIITLNGSDPQLKKGTYDYLDFDDDSQTYTPGTNATVLASISDVLIRTNTNDGGGGLFRVSTGESSPVSLFEIVAGTKAATFAGNVDINGTTLEVGDGGTNGVIDVKATANAYYKVNGSTALTLTATSATFAGTIAGDLLAGNSGARFSNDNWFFDTAAKERIYFAATHSYYKTAGATGSHIFRIAGDTQVAQITSDGDLDITGALSAETAVIEKTQLSGVVLTLRSDMADLDGSGGRSDGVAMNFEATDDNATFTPQAQIRMIVKDYTGDSGIPSEGTGNLAFYTGVGSGSTGSGSLNEVMRLMETGNVSIGSTDSIEKLYVGGNIRSSGSAGIGVAVNSSYTLYVGGSIAQSSGSIYSFGDVVLGNGGLKKGTTTIIDSSRNIVGATLTSQANLFLSTADGFAYLSNIGTGNSGIYVRGIGGSGTLRSHTTDNFRWEVSGSEKMMMDSDGRLIVGGLSANADDAVTLNGGGYIYAHRTNGVSGYFDKDNNGDVVTFRFEGGDVGHIGIEGNDSFYIQSNGGSGAGLRFHPTNGAISPMRNGALASGVISLGTATQKYNQFHVNSIKTYDMTHLYKSGTSNTQTAVLTVGSNSTRPLIQFSESTQTGITTGMSLEYNGSGSGDTNFMAINDITGDHKFKVFSGGQFEAISDTRHRIYSKTSAVGCGLEFSDLVAAGVDLYAQQGYIDYRHADSQSFGSGNAFRITSNQTTLSFAIDGSVVMSGGLYVNDSYDQSTIGDQIIGSNKRITVADGTTVKAAYGFISDSTTGMIKAATSEIGFITAAAERVRINADGLKLVAGSVLTRGDHHSGHLEGSYNNISANGSKTNPIYTIGSAYNPNESTLGPMYGIGYARSDQASYLSMFDGVAWGLYVAADGDARVFLNATQGKVACTGGYQIGLNTIVDASRNATFVDIDVSGDIVMSGNNNFLVIENSAENDAGIVFNDLQAGAWPNASSQRFMMQYNSGGESGVGSMIMGHDDDSYNGFYFKKGGELECKGNVTAFGTTSDVRLKENIERIADPIDKVKNLDGVTFNYKKDGARSTGLIAQQLLESLPEVVYENHDPESGEAHYAVRYGNVVGLLVEAIKELTQRIEELENGNHEDD